MRNYSHKRGLFTSMGQGHSDVSNLLTEVDVSRHFTMERARLKISVYCTNIGAETWLTPTELRALARELIDAAHDIESTPPPHTRTQPEGQP